MISAVHQPMVKTSYTERGNEYKESNIGKYVAGAGVAGTAAAYAGEAAFKGAKNLYGKAKIIDMNLRNKSKRNVHVKYGDKGASIVIESPKTAKQIIANFKSDIADGLKNIKGKTVQFAKDLKSNISKLPQSAKEKVTVNNIKELFNSAIDFVKTNAKKINKENIKKAGESIVEFAKKPTVKHVAGVAAGVAAVAAAGYAIDFVVNKISAHKADKNA